MGTSKGYIPPTTTEWRSAKSSVTRMIKSEDTTSEIKNAVGKYAKAIQSTNGGVYYSANFINDFICFLNSVNNQGLDIALDSIGLSALIGKDTRVIYNSVIDYFCELNSNIQDCIINECFIDILEEHGIFDLENLNSINVNEFILSFIIKYIQINFDVSFHEKIQGLSETLSECQKYIDLVNEYIDNTIRINYNSEKIISYDWNSEAGTNFINAQCKECYDLLINEMER